MTAADHFLRADPVWRAANSTNQARGPAFQIGRRRRRISIAWVLLATLTTLIILAIGAC